MDAINLGSETDKALILKIKRYLHDKNATLVKHDWALAGSQEIETWLFCIDNQEIKIELETYEGIMAYGTPQTLKALLTYLVKG
ncbi:hypothetical protein [Bartonella sp. HY038]|uniref:hypothetical protein n=1 Tax=Bartonella sp. HY038 TaxID=2759660 RepID=UPI0015FDA05E|nr:hypothetical protein [Bartonella sp. HY038]